ncbi:acyltransferase [Francisella philomiragia]|uniref:Acyltransferase family protein n=1 Tax=Francisella philomiragia subsp. philomiragia (strain ATCC 25017 / CCUG 19701 / FSC 153 / O\|nr:acyltransferase family protein [Francisella philomiragia]AJI47955.1 acyltransferase family protein [Francisella philomiragia]MBK2020539.1 acyltransferase [Francisella philomiragia]MBK2030309.1 acyltransferase [Francisella philomiragia]MBK2263833.1 acyltransferase [Francisella philomiragia]
MNNIKYRSDIDGLRAFAVLSVVLYHLEVSWVKSGFLGVDIFFVISGFLITKIIIIDLQDGTFSIKNFYLRRVRRILPALIFVLAISSFFAWLILLPQDLLNYAKSMVSVIASISNLFFFKTLSFGYFATDSSTIPLLHTWSLGVEEQFYIIWPVILIILFKLNISSKRYLLTITSLLIIASIAIFFYKHFPKFYYIPLNRGFELLFGCFLAIGLSDREHKSPNRTLLNIFSVVSLVLMVVPIFLISVSYPSFWMIVACFGATLFIYSGSLGYTPIINRLFSIKSFVAIGLISYSLYLWHWPIIAYLNYLSITITEDIATVVIILSIILATISYLFVEKPFRHKFKFSFLKSLTLLWIIPLVISIGFCIASKHQGFAFNHPNIDQNKLTFKYGFEKVDNNGCFYNFAQDSEINRNGPYYVSYEKNYDSTKCKVFDDKKSDILVLGNSHARSDWPMVSEWIKNADSNATLLAITPNDNENTAPYAPYPNNLNQKIKNDAMRQRFDFIKKAIKKNSSYKTIIIANMGGIGNKGELNIFGSIVKKALENNKHVILIVDTPYLGQPASYLPENRNISNLCAINRIHLNCDIDYGIYKGWIRTQTELYKKFKNQYPNQIEIVNPSKVICSKNECSTTIKGIPIYADSHHLSYIGSKLIGQKYLEEFGNPITNDR